MQQIASAATKATFATIERSFLIERGFIRENKMQEGRICSLEP